MEKNDIGVILLGLAMITATIVYFDRASNLEVRIGSHSYPGIQTKLMVRTEIPDFSKKSGIWLGYTLAENLMDLF